MSNTEYTDADYQPRAERMANGKALRVQIPRSSHKGWLISRNRPDPIALLQAQDAGRLQHLVPIKYGRMSASPFSFLRGSAAVMACDLTQTPTTNLLTVVCGDAHLSNFGLFASPERNLIFDINDFDETQFGPWEWDLKRLAASAAVAGRENGFRDDECRDLAANTAAVYRRSMRRFAEMRTLDIWYYLIDANTLQDVFDDFASKAARKLIKKMVRKARTRTQEQTLEKLTENVSDRRHFVSDPPLLVPLSDEYEVLASIVGKNNAREYTRKLFKQSWEQYLESLPEARRRLLKRFRVTDIALRVGGVGSVGTRCFIILLQGGAHDDALVLQLKEAGPSALEPYLPAAGLPMEDHAKRVVLGQRLMQTTGDIFLGWHASTVSDRHFYWRQLKDMKGSVDVADLDFSGFKSYLSVCALCLAHAHARSGDSAAITGYLGKNDTFDKAIGRFAMLYADQTEHDYSQLIKAIRDGTVIAETGI